MIAVAVFLSKLSEPLRTFKGKPGMCLFVRSPFVINPYFKTKANHQSVYLNHYILVRKAFMNYVSMRKLASKQEKNKGKFRIL